MHNGELARDYIQRAQDWLEAIDFLYKGRSWANVVRQSQEAAELALKGLLRLHRIDPPHLHDVSETLREKRERFPDSVREHIERLAEISHELRRDRELSFYGAEDLVPSKFYDERAARRAFDGARFVVDKATLALDERAADFGQTHGTKSV